jgi:hypothetical protein
MAKSKATNDQGAANPATDFVPPPLDDAMDAGPDAVAGADDRGLETPATVELDEPTVVSMDVDLPFFIGPIDTEKHGYISSRIDCTLTGEMGATFRRLLLGCREKHLTYSFNGRMTHVESGSDLVRWLVEQVADQMRELGDAR